MKRGEQRGGSRLPTFQASLGGEDALPRCLPFWGKNGQIVSTSGETRSSQTDEPLVGSSAAWSNEAIWDINRAAQASAVTSLS